MKICGSGQPEMFALALRLGSNRIRNFENNQLEVKKSTFFVLIFSAPKNHRPLYFEGESRVIWIIRGSKICVLNFAVILMMVMFIRTWILNFRKFSRNLA